MNKPDYTPSELNARHEKYAELCKEVAQCPLPEVKALWESAIINGLDTCDELQRMRRDWNMPNLSGKDVEAIISIGSACGILPDLPDCIESDRVRKWFSNRGVRG